MGHLAKGTVPNDVNVITVPITLYLCLECARIVTMSNTVRDNAGRHRFELDADGHLAFSNYRRDGAIITIMHTEVPPTLNGRDIGSAPVRGMLEIARAPGS